MLIGRNFFTFQFVTEIFHALLLQWISDVEKAYTGINLSFQSHELHNNANYNCMTTIHHQAVLSGPCN